MAESVIILTQLVLTRVPKDNSPLEPDEIRVDFLEDLKKSLIDLTHTNLKLNTPNLYLGLLGEFAFAKWLSQRNFSFDHRTRNFPEELKTDFIIQDKSKLSSNLHVDVKTSVIRPRRVARILSVEQYSSIPEHSDIIVWTFYSSWRNTITIDGWTPVSMLNECKLKFVAAPPEVSFSSDPAIDLDFSESVQVFEVPAFLMFDLNDLELKLAGLGGGVDSIVK